MKSKIVTVSLAVLVATSSLYAFGGPRGLSDCGPSKGGMFHSTRGFDTDTNLRSVMLTISQMELSSAQWSELRKVMFDLKEQRFENFNESKIALIIDQDGNFNKENFIKDRASFSKEMIESQANAMEKILNILYASQRKVLASKLTK